MGGYYDWCLFQGQDGMTYDAYEICGDCLDEEPTKTAVSMVTSTTEVSFVLGEFILLVYNLMLCLYM